jgi:murein DD-endopeptidase MepM/ murein hydrolase activator NlpD
MFFPLKDLKVKLSTSVDSWKKLDFNIETELPVSIDHPGSYMYRRKNHIHEGVDLYCNNNQEVVSIYDGVITNIIPFTGEIANTPWWNDTYAVVIEHSDYVLVYGEIIPDINLKIGQKVYAGQIIGNITTVLKVDKGRPMNMLHLEMYKKGTTDSVGIIKDYNSIPDNILNPITILLNYVDR